MKFKDYPKDLQRIVELTPEGWHGEWTAVDITKPPIINVIFSVNSRGCYTRTDYEKCRAAWLHETAGDVKAAEVDWRGLCEDMQDALKLALEYWEHRQKRYKNRSPVWVEKARKALERTK